MYVHTYLTSAIEMNFGIICNCLAVLKPFVRHVFPILIPSSRQNGEESDLYPSSSRRGDGSFPLSSRDRSRSNAGKHADGESTENIIESDGLTREYHRMV